MVRGLLGLLTIEVPREARHDMAGVLWTLPDRGRARGRPPTVLGRANRRAPTAPTGRGAGDTRTTADDVTERRQAASQAGCGRDHAGGWGRSPQSGPAVAGARGSAQRTPPPPKPSVRCSGKKRALGFPARAGTIHSVVRPGRRDAPDRDGLGRTGIRSQRTRWLIIPPDQRTPRKRASRRPPGAARRAA